MAGKNTLIKSFNNDTGLDLRSSDLTRKPEFASGLLNADYRKTGALNKRKGYHGKAEDKGGNGNGIFANVNFVRLYMNEMILFVGMFFQIFFVLKKFINFPNIS